MIGPTSVSVYPRTPHNPTDIVLAPHTGPGTPQSLVGTSNGQATCTFGMTATVAPSATAHGVAAFSSNYLGSPFHVSMTSVGRAAFTNNYVSSQLAFAFTTHGVAAFTGNYLAGPVPYSFTSDGVAAFSSNYLGSPFHVSMNANGVAHWTGNYLSSPAHMSATAHGVAAFTGSYLSSPIRAAATVHGVAGGAWYLSGPVYMYAQTTVSCGSTVAIYESGRIDLMLASRGVGALSFKSDFESFVSHGVAGFNVSLFVHGGTSALSVIVAGCYPYGSIPQTPGVVFSMQGAHVDMALTTATGIASLRIEGAPGVLAFVSNAGCDGFIVNGVILGVFIADFGGVTAQLDNSSEHVTHGFVLDHSTMRGQSTMVIVTPDLALGVNAGCLYYDSYQADEWTAQPPYYVRGTGPNADTHGNSIFPVPGGVFATLTGHDYVGFTASAGSGSITIFGQLPGVFIYLSSPIQSALESDGVANVVWFNGILATAFNGVGDWLLNALNVPSYDFEQVTSNGVGHMVIDGYYAGHVAMSLITSTGVGGALFWYLSSHVYMELYSEGFARFTHNTLVPDFGLESDGGCYPYVLAGVHRHAIEIDLGRPLRGLFFVSNGVSTVVARVEGPQLLEWLANDVGHMTINATKFIGPLSMAVVAGSLIHQVPANSLGSFFVVTVGEWEAYGVIIGAPDVKKFWLSQGVGGWIGDFQWGLHLVWHKRGDPLPDQTLGGVANATLNLFVPGPFAFRTLTNIEYFPGSVPQRYKYPPDAWAMNVMWGMSIRSRGRTRLYWDYLAIMGNLLARFFMIPQPWVPNIDGAGLDTSDPGYPINGYAMVGQFWPRHLKLPFRDVDPATHPNTWPEYEYWRR